MSLESNVGLQTQTLFSQQLQALFGSVTTKHSQVDSSCYLQQLYVQIIREKHLLIHSQKQTVNMTRTKWCQAHYLQATKTTSTENTQKVINNCFFPVLSLPKELPHIYFYLSLWRLAICFPLTKIFSKEKVASCERIVKKMKEFNYLFIYLFIYLLIYLFIYLFVLS